MRLSELIVADACDLALAAGDWEQAVRKGAAPLVEKGLLSQAYVDDIVAGARELGPYFVITKGVAIAHGLPETGVLGDCLGINRLEPALDFGSAANDPVRYLLVLGLVDGERHLEALAGLVGLLEDREFFGIIDGARDPEAIIAYVASRETEGKG